MKLYLIFFMSLTVFLCGCIGYRTQPDLERLFVQKNSGEIQCGIAKESLTPYKKTVIAGYGPTERIAEKVFFDVFRQQSHHAHVRAVVLHNGGKIGNGYKYIAYVSIDILIVTDALRDKVLQAFGSDFAIVLCATHPHSCIGGYWEGLLPEIAMGSFTPENLEYLAQKTISAIQTAQKNLQPAQIGFGRGAIDYLTINRRRSGDPVDYTLHFTHILNKNGDAMADLVWFAAHATMMQSKIHQFSSDFPGAFAREMERNQENYVALFFQGGLGDVRPSPPQKLWEPSQDKYQRIANRIEAVGKAIADEVKQLCKEVKVSSDVMLSHTSAPIYLGHISVNAVPDLLIPLEIAGRIWIELNYMPSSARLEFTNINNGIDNIMIANFPFEISSTLTLDLRKRIENNYDMGFVTSLANGWYSYLMHWPSAMWPPWGPEYVESFFDPGYSESVMDYAAQVSEYIYNTKN